MDGFTQRLLRRTDSLRTKEFLSSENRKSLRLQLILDAVIRDTLPLVVVELPDCVPGSDADTQTLPNVSSAEKVEMDVEDPRTPSEAEEEQAVGTCSEHGCLRGSLSSQCIEKSQLKTGFTECVDVPSGSLDCQECVLHDAASWVDSGSNMNTIFQSDTSSSSSRDDSPCSKGAVVRAWTAVMCAGTRLKMGEQILLAQEVCEVDCQKEEVGNLNCDRRAFDANTLEDLEDKADEFKDFKSEMITNEESEEQKKSGCFADLNNMECNENHKMEQVDSAGIDTCSENFPQDHLSHLMKKVCTQNDVAIQVCKALEVCKLSTSSASEERVECERLLLLANQKLKALVREIDTVKMAGPGGGLRISRGMLKLSDISLPLAEQFLHAADSKAVNFWFVCLAMHREWVVSTRATCETGSGAIYFSGPLHLPHLDEDFKAFLNIYCLRLKTKVQHNAKYLKVSKCKLFSIRPKQRPSKKKRVFLPQNFYTHSSFTLVGSLELNASNMRHQIWPLTKVTEFSPLSGMIHITVQPSLCSIEAVHSGFLSVLAEAAGGMWLWQYQWCDLEHSLLRFWDYPSEKSLDKPARGSVDLCCVGHVGPAPRELCSRPYAFQLLVCSCQLVCEIGNSSHVDDRHIFAANSKKEMEEWCDVLNSVLACIELWSSPDA